ncbi:hypothetical protein EYB25_006087 [Talaromyces marneffei]|nr:hypothetical protein EYB25_006087 [Talaromyces marneffei]
MRPKTAEAFKRGDVHEETETYARRRPLFKANQQAQNAADLLELVSQAPIEVMLESIDRKEAAVELGGVIRNGPFQMFRGRTLGSSNSIDFIQDDQSSPIHMESWSTPVPDLDEIDRYILQTSTDRTHSPTATPQEVGLQFQTVINDSLPLDKGSSGISSDFPSFIPSHIPPEISPECATDLKDIDMSTVKLLLDYYQNTLVPRLTPAEVPYKSPWKTLYIPNILSAVGDVVLSGNGSNAKMSLMFAALAISAFNLDGLDRSTGDESAIQARDWRKLGRIYRERATKRLKSSLLVLSTVQTKKEKYKDILMSMLSMITICVVSGDMENAAHYLRDLGQYISIYGMPKLFKSRKVQMLHSIYLYLCILTRCPDTQAQGFAIMSTHGPNQDVALSSQQPPTWDILVQCSPDEQLNDQVLAAEMLYFPKSIFEQIYSIPESLFKLILQTTQLAGEVAKISSRDKLILGGDELLASKIKDLEGKICSWDYNDVVGVQPIHRPPKEQFPHHFVQAMYAALMIYFYRGVRDLHIAAVQPYVEQTIYHLMEFDKMKEPYNDRSSNTCWPGFIAGCEATQIKTRNQIDAWMERSAQDSGFRMFSVARRAIQKVWNARSQSRNQNLSWNGILKDCSDLRVLVLT